MAIGIYIRAEGMTTEQYDLVIKKLEAAGQGQPKGRIHHSCFGPPDGLMVYDIWTSQEEFDAFGETLMPIIKETGFDIGQPDVMPVHNVIQ